MQFTFICPACHGRLSARKHQISATAACPRCESSLQIPNPADRKPDGAGQPGTLVAEEAPVAFRLDQAKDDSEMDMTPMVDVTFLLLIFFMVTAAFALQKSFEIPTPDDEQPSRTVQVEEDDDLVTVRVDGFNTFHVSSTAWGEEQEAPSEQDLLIALRQARLDAGANRMLVMANGEAFHEKVVTAMDAGTEVGMDEVKLMTVEYEE